MKKNGDIKRYFWKNKPEHLTLDEVKAIKAKYKVLQDFLVEEIEKAEEENDRVLEMV